MNFIKVRDDVANLDETLKRLAGQNLIIRQLWKVAICEKQTKPSSKVFRQRIVSFYDSAGNDVPAERTEFTDGDGEEFRYAIVDVPDGSELYAIVEFFYDDFAQSGYGSIFLKFWRRDGDIKVRWLDPW